MSKFKVGDIVRARVIVDNLLPRYSFPPLKGSTYIVLEVSDFDTIRIDNNLTYWHPNLFELVDNKVNFVGKGMNELKVGDKVIALEDIPSQWGQPPVTKGEILTINHITESKTGIFFAEHGDKVAFFPSQCFGFHEGARDFKLIPPHQKPSHPCTCDFYEVVLKYGCSCGGK